MEDIIEAARASQSTPRELSAVVSGKYRLVVSVTTKSFDPKVPKPSYQVHRIDAQYGKQSHSSSLRRGSGLALSSPSKPSGSALSLAGEELADAPLRGAVSSSATGAESSSALLSTGGDGSALTLVNTPPDTPPSVAKPSAHQEPRTRALTTVQKALFQETSLPAEPQESDLPVVSDSTDHPPTPPDSVPVAAVTITSPTIHGSPSSTDASAAPLPSVEATTEKRRRGLSAKPQADGSAKKKKS